MTPSTKTGRPASFDRDKAIELAMNLFWDRGYLAVSAKELAEAMGIQRSSFYNSFGDREAVFREALTLYGQRAPDRMLDEIRPGDPVAPSLARMFRNLCRVRVADEQARGCLVVNSIGELVGVDSDVGPLIQRALQARQSVFTRLLQQAVDQQEIPAPANPTATAAALLAFLMGINTLSKVERDEQRLWEICRAFLADLGVPETVLNDAEQTAGA